MRVKQWRIKTWSFRVGHIPCDVAKVSVHEWFEIGGEVGVFQLDIDRRLLFTRALFVHERPRVRSVTSVVVGKNFNAFQIFEIMIHLYYNRHFWTLKNYTYMKLSELIAIKVRFWLTCLSIGYCCWKVNSISFGSSFLLIRHVFYLYSKLINNSSYANNYLRERCQ